MHTPRFLASALVALRLGGLHRLAGRGVPGTAESRGELVDGVDRGDGEELFDRVDHAGVDGDVAFDPLRAHDEHRPARTGRNPRTGEAGSILDSVAPAIRAGKALKETVNRR